MGGSRVRIRLYALGKLLAGAAQGGHGKRQRIEPLIIPQLGEVKTNRSRLAMFAALVLAGPWMLATLIDFTRRLYGAIPQLAG